MSEYVEGVFGGQALKLTPLQRLKAEKENLQAIVLYVKKNESSEDFEYVYIHKTGAYIGGQDVVEVSIIGMAGEIPPEKEWVYDVATFEGDIVYINGGHTIDELLLLDYLPDIVEVESWHNAPLYDPEEIEYQYTLIEQTEEKITLLSKSINERIDDEIEELHSSIEVTSEKISSDVRKSLYSSSLGKISQDISGLRTSLPVESLQRDLPKGTELVIMDSETYNIFTVITSADTNKGDTQIPIEEASINISAESTIHLELSSVASKIAQLADSYTLNIEGDGVVTGFKSALGEDGVSDFVIQADKFRVVGTKNGQPFGEGKSVFEVDTDDEKIYLNSNVVLRGNIVQTPDGEEYPIPVFRGKYSETYTYHKYDQVSHNGAVWIFMSDTPKTGEEPVIGSPYWDIYVEKGDKGTNAPLIKLSGATQVIKVSATGEVTPSANFTVIGTPINTTITTFQYSTNGAFFTTTPPTGVTRSGNTVTVNPNTSTFITLTIRASDGTVSDSFTIARVGDGVDGKDGADGTDGVNGVDGVWGILSNHAHTVPSSSTGAVSNYTGSGTTIQVFEGSTALTYHTTIANSRFTVGTPTVSPASAITVGARSGRGTTTCTVADHSAMNNAQDMVQITYPITARRANGTSVTFNLVQTITKSKAGEKGEKGDQGEQGPGLIFRGNWQENETYYRTADRRDAVKYGDNYYLCNINNTTGVLPTNSTYWTQMNYFDNVATKLLLAEDAFVNQTLNVGSGGSKSAGISSVGGVRFWAGSQIPTSAPFRVEEDGSIFASKGTFSGEVFVGDEEKHVRINQRGIRVTEGSLVFITTGLTSSGEDQIYSGLDRKYTTDPAGSKSVAAPVIISAQNGVEIYKGKLNVWQEVSGKKLIDQGQVTNEGLLPISADKIASGRFSPDRLPENVIYAAPGVSMQLYSGTTYVDTSQSINVTFGTALPSAPFLIQVAGRTGDISISNITRTGFRITRGDWPGGDVHWFAWYRVGDAGSSSCASCYSSCEASCEAGCQSTCESSCQTTAQTCTTECQKSCQAACESTCQIGCMVSCQITDGDQWI